jgi:hypothetical protein
MSPSPKADVPTFSCTEQRTRSGVLIWSFDCPHCRKRHIHGAVPGHRAAHCHRPNSPFAAGGYVLARSSDDLTPRGRADKRQQGGTQARAEQMSDLPNFRDYCEEACRKLWGQPSSATARELRWENRADAYATKTFDRGQKVWFDHGAGWGGSTLELVAHSKRQPKPEKLRGKAFIDTWAEAHAMGLVPDPPPEKPKGKANGARAPDLIAKQTPPNGQQPPDDADLEIERLARMMNPLDYERERKIVADKLGFRVTVLDKLVEAKKAELFPPGPPAPPTSEEQAIIDELNADHSVVIIGSRTRVLRFENTRHDAGGEIYYYRLPTYLRFQDFRDYYLNRKCYDDDGEPFAVDRGNVLSIAQWWLEHHNRKTYDGVIFVPGAKPVIDNRLNLWTGFGVEPQRGDWSLMREHIRTVLAAGDPAVNAYTIKWMADAVQRPDRQAEVALFFIGGFGTGKGLLGRAMCRIFGQHGRHVSSSEHLTGKFNAHLQQCCFLFADEAVAPGDKKAEGAMKRLITEDTLHIEPKGVDPFEVPNRLHVMGASNHEQAVSAGEKERRYVVQRVAEARQQDESCSRRSITRCVRAASRPCSTTSSTTT